MPMKSPATKAVRRLVGLAAIAAIAGFALPGWARPASLTARYADSEINVRSAPTTQAAVPRVGRVGDRVEVLDQTRGRDGYTWYLVKSSQNRYQGWIRGDFVSFGNGAAGRAIATTPRSPAVASPASMPAARSTQAIAAVAPASSAPQPYSQEAIRYFTEIALGSEYGNASGIVRKWQEPMRIKVHGSPTQEDLRTLSSVMGEINTLLGTNQMRLDDANPNVQIYFVPESDFSRYEPNYRPLNYGYAWTWWNNDTIDRARILVSTVGINQQERSHLIREELTQSLGLLRDSFRYSDSIFYQDWTATTQFSTLDRQLIQMLYRPDVLPGMSKTDVLSVLNQASPARSATACGNNGTEAPLTFSLDAAVCPR